MNKALIVMGKGCRDIYNMHVYAELGKLLYESNILHITSYFHLKSNLKVTYYFF